MQRCSYCGYYGPRNAHCPPLKRKLLRKSPRSRHHAHRDDNKNGPLPTEHFIPDGKPRYSYKPFNDTRCIRLLVLLPGDKWEPVRCELVVQSLDTARYEAISYAWGPEQEKGDILCHDKRLKVPWTLEEALRRFRRLKKKRILWADSVCINQDDDIERGHQVQNMSKVYERARTVLVWLGTGAWNLSPSAMFQFIRTMDPSSSADALTKRFHDQVLVNSRKSWFNLAPLNHTGWFERMWIVQEICLASEAIVHAGAVSVNWKALNVFCSYFLGVGLPLDMDSRFPDALRVADANINLQSLRYNRTDQDIPQLLFTCQERKCLNPSDRVYALYGHKTFQQTLANPFSNFHLPVDYTISHKKLYASVAIRVLQMKDWSSIDILRYINHDRASVVDCEASSWAPRWDLPNTLPPWRNISWKFEAHAQTAVEASATGFLLSIGGFVFDSISWASGVFLGTEFLSNAAKAFNGPNPHPFKETWYHLKDVGGKDWRSLLKAFCSSMSLFLDDVENQRFLEGAVGYARINGLDVSGVEDLFSFENISYFQENFECDGYRIFSTSRGWIGIGPAATLPGDEVCIFLGAGTPFVVRQLPSASESLCRLCGQCYVPGIMKGEAVEMWKGGEFEKTTFNLI